MSGIKATISDTIDQANVLALLALVEQGGVWYATEVFETWPKLSVYMGHQGWLAPMRNGVARSTVQGEALRRFAALAPKLYEDES